MKRIILSLLLVLGLTTIAWAADSQVSEGAVVQANGNRADFERALVLASNMHEVLKKAKFEVVVYGANVHLITAFSGEIPLIEKVRDEGIEIIGRPLSYVGPM